jgi:hypothetical protein
MDYGYSYPRGLDLKPGSDLHRKLVTKLLERGNASRSVMSQRYDSWQKLDETLTAYVPLDEKETEVQDEDDRKSVSIVIPYSYAVLETLLTYSVAAFLEHPIFKYRAVGPEDQLGTIMLELLIDQQTRRAKMALNIYVMFRDAHVYGLGVVHTRFTTKYGKRTKKREVKLLNALGNIFTAGTRKSKVRTVTYEGNELENIDPYQYLPDPNVPVHQIQRGEFVGWMKRSNRMEMLSDEHNDPSGMLFNAKYLKHIDGRSSLYYETDSEGSRSKYQMSKGDEADSSVTSPDDILWMYVNLIPEEWELGNGKMPEKWLFGLVGDQVIVAASPVGLDHDEFPVAVCAPNYDGYSVSPISHMEILYPLQHRVDWLMNSHQANVRRAVNDIVIVDPTLIDVDSLKEAKEGGIAFLKRGAWGKGSVKDAVHQLDMTDITRGHVADAMNLMQVMERTSGASDNLQGIAQKLGERTTKYQVQSAKMSALSRIEMKNRLAGIMAMTDIADQVAQNTQQLMSRKTYVDILGRWVEDLRNDFGRQGKQMAVSPDDIIVGYDVMPQDGSVVGSEYLDTWVQLFQIISQNPMLSQLARIDLGRMFKHIARMGGAKNIDDFTIQENQQQLAQVIPDQAAASEAAAGNIVPQGAA